MNTVIYVRVFKNAVNFLTRCATIASSKRALLLGINTNN
jgi:hypothetical protein